MLGDSAQGCPCSPAQASSLAPPPKAQEPGPEPWAPPRASAGDLRPQSPGPSLHLAPPPRSTASEGPGPERKGPRPAPRSPPPAGAHPGSPGNTPVREQDDQAPGSRPERRPAADRGPPPPGADAGPLPRTACASLQEATRLIREEFAFDGYLDNGLEALIMGTGGTVQRVARPRVGPPHSRLCATGAAPGSSRAPQPGCPRAPTPPSRPPRGVHPRPEGPHLRHLLRGRVGEVLRPVLGGEAAAESLQSGEREDVAPQEVSVPPQPPEVTPWQPVPGTPQP